MERSWSLLRPWIKTVHFDYALDVKASLDESYTVCFILITVVIPVRVENYEPYHASLMSQTRYTVHVVHNLRPGWVQRWSNQMHFLVTYHATVLYCKLNNMLLWRIWGRGSGGRVPFILCKKRKITEGRKAGRTSKNEPPLPLFPSS